MKNRLKRRLPYILLIEYHKAKFALCKPQAGRSQTGCKPKPGFTTPPCQPISGLKNWCQPKPGLSKKGVNQYQDDTFSLH